MNKCDLILSALGHTWILDLDGTLLVHNGYMDMGHDSLLEGVREFLDGIPKDDFILITTARPHTDRNMTEKFLKENNVRYDHIVFGLPYGERILVNDTKPSGLVTSIAVPVERDGGLELNLTIDNRL